MTLLCGYAAKSLSTPESLQHACGSHAVIIPQENLSNLQSDRDYLRKLSLLELTNASQSVDRALAHDELSLMRSQMFQLGKLSVLGELCAGMAHEINNPLTIITSLSNQVG